MPESKSPKTQPIPALKVTQWLEEWDSVEYEPEQHRSKPGKGFYLFSIKAKQLLRLSGIQARTTKGGVRRSQDLGIQRRHDQDRSELIFDFVRYGFPWSELSARKRSSGEYRDLRKPGWLPTAVVVNILRPGDQRQSLTLAPGEALKVQDQENGAAQIVLPDGAEGDNWFPKSLPPIEVIDGQHRLWAFQDKAINGDFELPVVAFYGLDISWQAYLFWTINLRPVRINPSLAFDLYPLLRTEDWLEKFEGHSVYRESRAQEITEALWAHPESPWHERINMLGEKGLSTPMVRQAAWIRSLMATYVRSWEGARHGLGGLYGAPLHGNEMVLPWSRAQQVAFIIYLANALRDAVSETKTGWARSARRGQSKLFGNYDAAFYGEYSLLSTDQGIRALLHVSNDLCFLRSDQLKLDSWGAVEGSSANNDKAVSAALKSLGAEPGGAFLDEIAQGLASFDWRTSSEPSLSNDVRLRKAAFRGSGGYRELRLQLLEHLSGQSGRVATVAAQVLDLVS